MTPRAYPLPRLDDDPRFSFGLFLDLRRVLVEHGYPEITSGADLVELRQALFGFLYADAAAAELATTREDNDEPTLREGLALAAVAEQTRFTERAGIVLLIYRLEAARSEAWGHMSLLDHVASYDEQIAKARAALAALDTPTGGAS